MIRNGPEAEHELRRERGSSGRWYHEFLGKVHEQILELRLDRYLGAAESIRP